MSEKMLNKISEVRTSSNARSSYSRAKYDNTYITKKRRGSNKYYLFIKERYFDIYVFIKLSYLYPTQREMESTFTYEDLVKRDKSLKVIEDFLHNLSKEKGKKIQFSPKSIDLSPKFYYQ